MKIEIEQIGQYIALADDQNLTQTALREGTIKLEKSIFEIPEVKALRYGSTVFDVGAFIGDTAVMFADLGCHVFAFEPQPDAAFCLRYNAWSFNQSARNWNAGRIEAYECAVGRGDEVVGASQNQLDGNLGTRSLTLVDNNEVECKSLDSLYQVPSLIKIDVEGMEPNVLQGAMRALTEHSPTLVIEVYPEMLARHGFTKADIYDPLIALGYTIRTVVGEEDSIRWDIVATKP